MRQTSFAGAWHAEQARLPGHPVAEDDAHAVEAARPDDCDCSPLAEDLPCWPCFRAGFHAPNPEVTDG